MTDTDRSQPLNVPRAGRSSRYRTHSSGSLSSSFGSPSGLTNINNTNGGATSVHSKKTAASSTGNNNIGSISTSMSTGTSAGTLPQFDEKHAAAGNIFEHRQDWSILNRLPLHKRNAIHIRLEDEGPYGNDETRCFVLSQLSMVGCTDVTCTVCGQSMVVYDRYPLVDGTLFLSPIKHSDNGKVSIAVFHNDRQLYLHGICLECLSMRSLHVLCRLCKTKFNFDPIIFGTLYYYDLFAAFPCCQARLSCSKCFQPIVSIKDGLINFSNYSSEFECGHCGSKNHHFVKPFDETFEKHSILNNNFGYMPSILSISI
ncbi:unnamed protein product [Rotaria sordida]|uniref:Headcase middle domain-containing protein n=1 Tax=Rotaria sordida TaxID=392033 RepID=A0A814D6U7_9BILA|nr:unnamed protein product [Rotaria sordida]CAF0998989.1 unnamed protein product [Rotaria sordida]CAF1004753.1 unnamed protein product [Rotaria sordida]